MSPRRSVLAALVVAACSSTPRPVDPGSGAGSGSGSGSTAGSGSAAPAAPVLVPDRATAEAHQGEQVEIHGMAGNAMLGAAVVVGPGFVVYCLGYDSWAAVAGQQVVARGTLELTTEFAADSDGDEPAAGTSGAVWVLRGCAPDPAP